MDIKETLSKNDIEFTLINNEEFPVAIQCPFCKKTSSGMPYFTLSIDKFGYCHCSSCSKNTDMESILTKLNINNTQNEIKILPEIKSFNRQIKNKALVRRFDSIKSVPISWLWKYRIALGKLTMIAGDPGLGKSLLTATLAAHISCGNPWPVDESVPPTGDVILLSAEDDPADTIKPRLEAAGADCTRIHIIEAIQIKSEEKESKQRMFSFKNDVSVIEDLLCNMPNCQLLIIDPVSAYLDSADSNNNSDIRGLLAPLSDLASKHKIAIVLVSHLNKNSSGNASYRVMGSLAFTAAVRAAFIVTKDKSNSERRLFMPLKNNIAKDSTGLAYSVVTAENGAPSIVWEPEVIEITLDEALSSNESKENHTLTDEAIDFLKFILSQGPVKADDIQKEASKIGINKKPLVLARVKLRIKPKKVGFNPSYWEWELPAEDNLFREDA